MNHQAIYNTHPTVERIFNTENGVVAYDADGNGVTLDADAVASETTAVLNARNLKILRAERNQLLRNRLPCTCRPHFVSRYDCLQASPT